MAKSPSIDKLPESGLTLKAADTCTKSTLQELGAIVSRALSVDRRLGAQDVLTHDRLVLPETVVLLTSTVDRGTSWFLQDVANRLPQKLSIDPTTRSTLLVELCKVSQKSLAL